MTNTPILGIDLGTTNSLAAIVDEAGLRVIGGKAAITPSVVAILPDGSTIVGERAKAMAIQSPDRVIHSVKRLIGRAVSEVRIEAARLHYNIVETAAGLARVRIPLDGKDGRPSFRDYSPEEISAMILREVWRKAVAELGGEPDSWRRVVVTVPAYFDEPQRQATKQAAKIAGLEVVRLVNEPTAASLAYGLGERSDGKVLVYDLGGGTFDVSVLSIQDGIFRVLSTHGDTQLGGDDFDRGILELILTRIREETGADLGRNPNVLATLRLSAEGIKIRLSEQDAATLEIDVGREQPVSLTVTRDDFEALVRPHIDRTLASVRSALEDADVTMSDIDEVVLVGGSTRIPCVRAALSEMFGHEPHTEIDPDLAIAIGAARQGSVLSGNETDLLLLDVIPLSLGLETIGGTFSKLILRNATVPCSVTEEFSTQVDNQTGIDINLYQGERELVADCRPIGSFKLTGLPPMKAGLARVAVTFTVNADGLLRVTARELRSGQTASVEVRPTLGLSDAEVNAIVAESIEHAGPDMVARESIELRNKARAVADGTERILSQGGAEGLAPEQRYAIQKALSRVRKLLDGDDLPALDSALERLSSLTMQLADDMIGASVKKALAGTDGGTHGR